MVERHEVKMGTSRSNGHPSAASPQGPQPKHPAAAGGGKNDGGMVKRDSENDDDDMMVNRESENDEDMMVRLESENNDDMVEPESATKHRHYF